MTKKGWWVSVPGARSFRALNEHVYFQIYCLAGNLQMKSRSPKFPWIPTIHQLTEKNCNMKWKFATEVESNEYPSSKKITRVLYYSTSTGVLAAALNADDIRTRISAVMSKRSEVVFCWCRSHRKVVVFGVASASIKVGQVNTKTLTFARCQQVKNVVTCTYEIKHSFAVQW